MFLQIHNGAFLPEGLNDIDRSLFFKINSQWHNGFSDVLMPFVRQPLVWLPFYFFLILFVLINFKGRGWLWILFLVVTVMITDFISGSVIKGLVPRLRPCRDPAITHQVRWILSYCPGGSSFLSAHAANHFAISTFIFVTFKKAISRLWGFIFLWALLICYAQVYVGVHFPSDIIAGAIVGIVLGYISSSMLNRYFPLPVSH